MLRSSAPRGGGPVRGAGEHDPRVFVAPVALGIAYEGDYPPEDSHVLYLVPAVAGSHGGTFSGGRMTAACA